MIRILMIAACMCLWGASATAEDDCPIFETRAWHAWVDQAVEDGGNRLIVFGQIDLPNPGYTVDWEEGPMDRMNPPSLRIRLTATPPEGAAIQVITPIDLTLVIPTTVSTFRSVFILCGDRSLVEIADVYPKD